ncbi:MAG: ATP-binding protein [Clostridia bacterium]|nr:ATP-binding protein [Clostridia bacterium]
MEKVYFKRKIDEQLETWFKSEGHSPALVYGIRQCGKSESIKQFAKNNFKYVNLIDFWKTPNAVSAFDDSLEVDEILKSLSALFPSFKFVPNETVLILDEIQDCPKARLAFKSFKEDGRFEVISSGSYVGLNIDNSHGVPKPNGSEDFIEMKTMDFEEFLWALGYNDEHINNLLEFFENKMPVPETIHNKMKQLFKEYVCVGGYPEVVLKFIQTNSFSEVFKKVNSLVIDIKGDPSKRLDSQRKPLYTTTEIMRIQKAFDLIASFIVNNNHRFVTSKISGNSYQRDDAINYLVNASIAFEAYNVEVPSLPLGIRKIASDYKLFYGDIGIMINTLGFDVIQGILQDNLGMSKGYLFEAIVADSLYKAGVPLYYFGKDSGLEIDFVISYKGFSTLVEAKSKTGNTKSSKQVMNNPNHYGKTKLIKIGDYNISETGDIITIPHYLTFAIGKTNI